MTYLPPTPFKADDPGECSPEVTVDDDGLYVDLHQGSCGGVMDRACMEVLHEALGRWLHEHPAVE